MTDTEGLMMDLAVTAADVTDRDGGREVLKRLKESDPPRLELIWVDGNYSGPFQEEMKEQYGWTIEVVKKQGQEGFQVLPRRWVVERTFGWLGRNRRLSKDYEGRLKTSETWIRVAMIRLMLRRQGRILETRDKAPD